MIYLYDDSIVLKEEEIKKYIHLLNNERKKKIEKYRFIKDKSLSFLAAVLLKAVLINEFGIKEIPPIHINETGKPYIEGFPIYFNLSHCDKAVACAVDMNKIGIDVENYNDGIEEIKDVFITEKEKEKIIKRDLTKNNEIKELVRMWTLKESYGKYKGLGLNYDFKNTDFSAIENSSNWQKLENLEVMSKLYGNFAMSVFAENLQKIKKINKKQIFEFLNNQI